MPTPFAAKKAKILSQLSAPSTSYTDASPKGTVDAPIRSLVDEINAISSLVTTSSCSGRIAIYAEGLKPTTTSVSTTSEPDSTNQNSNNQGKGSGHWLFVSHLAIPVPSTLSSLLSSLENETPSSQPIITPPSTDHPFHPTARLVHLKFEPLILHVLCASLAAAKSLLTAAQAAGFRESGVASLPSTTSTSPDSTTMPASAPQNPVDGPTANTDGDRKSYPKRIRKPQRPVDESVMVAIRTTGLAMDAPIGMVGADGGVEMLVGEGYVAGLVGVANERFAQG
ncbi:hypothetical protein K461DRAFT_49235 [Myriangium duriaei CBS 260.36]|uniref:tRNA(Phe) 7-[(3-amino-3-carboxypropyl)-4-demethylwyosine(37)-N(4)]-methyltransferase n=1 Tax=Myriangium duriaei CBS 260.36 TaxID=1168546 RepID=A0A9P4IW47_9PEZI|nr:hypothetical protein K461DRAFT_49235 [Myriangium duriaei CBS 260.36]